MRSLLGAVLFVSISFLNPGCSQPGAGPQGQHGEVSAGVKADSNDPNHVTAEVGAKYYFRKRPLTATDFTVISAYAYAAGVKCAKAPNCDKAREKRLCVDRLAYKFRVKASQLKGFAEKCFDDGYAPAPTTSP